MCICISKAPSSRERSKNDVSHAKIPSDPPPPENDEKRFSAGENHFFNPSAPPPPDTSSGEMEKTFFGQTLLPAEAPAL